MEICKYVPPVEDNVVFATDLIEVFVPRQPHTHASFGGHLVVRTKIFRSVCSELTSAEGQEVWAAVQACTYLMIRDLGAVRTNNQDNGNWAFLPGRDGKPRFHVHIYGRSPREDQYDGPGYQRWGLSLNFPHPTELARIDGEPVEDGATWLQYIEPISGLMIEHIKAVLPKLFANFMK